MSEQIAIIGFGEAGQHIGRGLAAEGKVRVAAYDLRHAERQLIDAAADAGIALKDSSAAAMKDAAVIFSFVTASSAADAARVAAPHLTAGQTYIDFNSVSPKTKRAVADAIAPSGAAFVEAAIMAPVPGPNHKVPVLVSAPGAADIAGRLNAIGMKIEVAGERIGDASLSKMLRSIFIKGIEALMLESLVAARHAGIEERILDSVQKTLPGINWRELAAYNLERTYAHGKRRAAEMFESAATVAELGLDPFVTQGIARRIQWAHEQLKGVEFSGGKPTTYQEVLDVLEAKLAADKRQDAAE
ncbi:MAG: NAD(P)-dependent oxidoreductase [Bradyrhizobiaceae bacterium]|nr:NAD(P)-dependent oxidoreductase [Bradyrhizobiaceae bacterium]